MKSSIKISELLEKLYKGYLLSDEEYNKYLFMVKAYRAKEQGENSQTNKKEYSYEIFN